MQNLRSGNQDIPCASRFSVSLAPALLAVSLMACTAGCTGLPESYVADYNRASAVSSAKTGPKTQQELETMFLALRALFADLKQPGLSAAIENTYAEKLYFNDTLHTFHERKSLSEYLLATASRVSETRTRFKEYAQSDDSYFVRWEMDIVVRVAGKSVKTNSIGMSQIKFDQNGKIVFHQDFWDNSDGLFRHLPFVGFVLNKTYQRL